jgi:hypothetical protein
MLLTAQAVDQVLQADLELVVPVSARHLGGHVGDVR